MTTEQHRTPTSAVLAEAECRELLGATTVGRVAFLGADGIVLRPVNYRVADGDLLFRVSAGGELRGVADGDREVAFEVDHHSPTSQQGWSVVVRGTCTSGERPDVFGDEHARHPVPWGSTGATVLDSLRPRTLTGRRVSLVGVPR